MQTYYSSSELTKVRQHIKNGGIIAYPTESCYGLGCDPFNRMAVQKLIVLKQRAKRKGMIVIGGNLTEAKKVILPLSKEELNELKSYWPGFYSIVLPVSKHVPKILIGQHAKIALRITNHPLVQQLCASLNQVLVSTSANRSRCKAIKTYKECKRQFGADVLVLPGLTNFIKRPSTIIDWQTKKVLR